MTDERKSWATFFGYSGLVLVAGMLIGACLQRRAVARDRSADLARLEQRQAVDEHACHDDYVRAQALGDQCARLADRDCAGSAIARRTIVSDPFTTTNHSEGSPNR